MKKIISILLVLLVTTSLNAQESSDSSSLNPRFGIIGLLGFDYHSVNFQRLPGVPNCCPRFENGTGTGYSFGLLFEKPLSSIFIPGIRLTYNSLSGTLSTNENSFVSINDKPAPAVIEHDITSKFTIIGVEPYIALRIIYKMSVFGGLSVGFLQTGNFNQEEVLKEPVNQGTFENGLRVRNKQSGGIPDVTKMTYNPFLGLRMSFQLNSSNTFFAVPEFLMSYGLKNMVNSLDWKIYSWRFGLALKYSPKSKEPIKDIFEKKYKIDTISIKKEDIVENLFISGKETSSQDVQQNDNVILTTETIHRTDTLIIAKSVIIEAAVNALALDADGKEGGFTALKIEEFLSIKMIPLLNYIFFDENSSNLLSKYKLMSKTETQKFELKQLFNEKTMNVYFNGLNVIGLRMQKEPNAIITLTGCNSDEGQEKNNLALSLSRAEKIRDYLVNNWDITSERIKILSRNLPAQPSNPVKDDGIAENRRVEIKSDNLNITEPLIIADTIREANPPVIKFYHTCKSDYDIKEWKLNILQNDRIIESFSGTGSLPPSNLWTLNLEKGTLAGNGSTLEYYLDISDIKGHNFVTDKKHITVEQKTIRKKQDEMKGDRRIDRFSLILFDYAERTLSKENLSITKMIKNYISTESDVLIEGYSDRIGEQDYNRQLSLDRAKAVEKALNIGKINVIGYGSSKFLYNNDSPEGRFYCRTVNITVETPIKK